VRGPMRLVRDQHRQILRQDSMRLVAPEVTSQETDGLVGRAMRPGQSMGV
jgi:hypothetical protein